jgi:hypothetical protein
MLHKSDEAHNTQWLAQLKTFLSLKNAFLAVLLLLPDRLYVKKN